MSEDMDDGGYIVSSFPIEDIPSEWCPYCRKPGIERKCKVLCPDCGLVLSNCNGD